jgi:hypothetical protein
LEQGPLFRILIACCVAAGRPRRTSQELLQMRSLRAYAGMGMTPAQLVGLYRDRAAKCLLVARTQTSAAERMVLLDMAQAWIALAKQAEKNESLSVIYETTPKAEKSS